MGTLSHLKVLDLSRVLAGPWSSQILADLGAEVIKIEHPEGGDDTRKWGPPFLKMIKAIQRLSPPTLSVPTAIKSHCVLICELKRGNSA